MRLYTEMRTEWNAQRATTHLLRVLNFFTEELREKFLCASKNVPRKRALSGLSRLIPRARVLNEPFPTGGFLNAVS